MCGIAGLCKMNNTPLVSDAKHWVKNMTDLLAHRGPDGQGVWCNDVVALGHRRLAIIDLSTGYQPMTDSSKRYTIVFNGEIYNFAEIRKELEEKGCIFETKSDTEVILNAWQIWGTNCLKYFNGMFAFVLWDDREKILFCARDRFGKKPFYYSTQNDTFAFASELTALASLPYLKLSVSKQTIMQYLAYEYIPTPQSMYSQIKKLPPAHFLLLKGNDLKIERYWDMPVPLAKPEGCQIELMHELKSLLEKSVKMRMISDVPLGVFLSGGIDSSIITGLMSAQSPKIKTFSIGFTEASYDESSYARLVSKYYGSEHSEFILSADECADILPSVAIKLDEPMSDASVVPTYLLSQMTRKKVTVALGGDGADELFAGYEHFVAIKMAEIYRRCPKAIRNYIIEPIARNLPGSAGYSNLRLAAQTFLQGAYAPNWHRAQTLLTSCSPEMQESLWKNPDLDFLKPEKIFASTHEHYSHWAKAEPFARAFHVYARQYLLDDILVKVDRCSMMHSLEVRAPFLDKDLVEFVAKLPTSYKLKGFKRKYFLKKTCADFLPKEILTRKKKGFQIPVAAWLRTKLRHIVEELLGYDYLKKQGLFNPVIIRSMVDAHMSERNDYRRQLWTLLVLQLWLKSRNPIIE